MAGVWRRRARRMFTSGMVRLAIILLSIVSTKIVYELLPGHLMDATWRRQATIKQYRCAASSPSSAEEDNRNDAFYARLHSYYAGLAPYYRPSHLAPLPLYASKNRTDQND